MKYLYIANWKMNVSFNESIAFCKNSKLQELSKKNDIIICPSFIALAPLADILKNTNIQIGAQNCSEYSSGAYTGEVSATSLAQIGATHCIVGHSERRMYFNEMPEQIIKKIALLYQNNIMPIICIGETQQDFDQQQTKTVLVQQLNTIITCLKNISAKSVIFAYEPIWSIGTGIIPEQKQLIDIFTWLSESLYSQLPEYHIQLLYGGSVDQNNIAELKKIPPINGFLIGGASTNFETFKNIITQ